MGNKAWYTTVGAKDILGNAIGAATRSLGCKLQVPHLIFSQSLVLHAVVAQRSDPCPTGINGHSRSLDR